uniref:Uncharacterized protein n=1 Tax=Acrobeloides nanus TaxID=290746 RepID=A0A914EFP3_9BILA
MERFKQQGKNTYKNSYKFQLRRCTHEEIKNEPELKIGSMLSTYGGNEEKYKSEFYPEEYCQIHIQRQG